ncbi:MAG: acyl-CoA dehydrogenase family protein [Sulfurifustis sp.]
MNSEDWARYGATPEQYALCDAVSALCRRFPPEYWRECDRDKRFPEEFYRAFADAGFLGIATPERFGGSGLGIMDAVLVLWLIGRSGAGFTGNSAVHINIFGMHPVVVHGSDEQRERFLPPVIKGEHRVCFGVTEPDAGLDTSRITTVARREGDHYIVNGRKLWTSTAQEASHILLLARTTPRGSGKRPVDGLSLFYNPLDRSAVEVRRIPKMGREAVDSNMLFIDGLKIPVENRIGAEGEGFGLILDGLNPERIVVAAASVGLGQCALERAARYARERIVFDRPIGANQGIQHPLAEAWINLEAAWWLTVNAARRYDAGQPCGAEANAAKYFAAEAAFKACETAVLTHGGMGYAKEYDVERFARESWIARLAPVSRQMVLSFIAERVLDQPRSY